MFRQTKTFDYDGLQGNQWWRPNEQSINWKKKKANSSIMKINLNNLNYDTVLFHYVLRKWKMLYIRHLLPDNHSRGSTTQMIVLLIFPTNVRINLKEQIFESFDCCFCKIRYCVVKVKRQVEVPVVRYIRSAQITWSRNTRLISRVLLICCLCSPVEIISLH